MTISRELGADFEISMSMKLKELIFSQQSRELGAYFEISFSRELGADNESSMSGKLGADLRIQCQ